jgi:hypothetical protein
MPDQTAPTPSPVPSLGAKPQDFSQPELLVQLVLQFVVGIRIRNVDQGKEVSHG